MKTKICARCKKRKLIDKFYKLKKRIHPYCSDCCKKERQKWVDKNTEYIKTKKTEWRLANKKKCYAATQKWTNENKDRVRRNLKKWQQKARNEIRNCYVKGILKRKGIIEEHIKQYPELLEITRLQIKSCRTLNTKIYDN